ncbi:MAG: GIY-YIG nuclease family protein [Colwellia sp.]
MSTGYVYILVNPSFRDNLIKIGLTTRTPEVRAKELSRTTGLPNEFVVAYKKHVFDCEVVEKLVHIYLEKYRSNDRREFFNLPTDRAISVIERISKLENSLEMWNKKTTNLDNKQIKWHMHSDEFIMFFRYNSPFDQEVDIVDFWHTKDDGDEVYLIGDHNMDSQSLKSNGFLSDEMRLNPGDYVVWCGKDRNSALEKKPKINYSIIKITQHSYVSGFCAIPRTTEEGFPIQLSTPGSGASIEYSRFAYQKAKELGVPRVWSEEYC